jgi:hypothetical protein
MKPTIHELKNGIQNAVSKTPIETHLARGLFILAGLLIAAAATAQTKEQSTVRIKKIETINGVKTVTDTTYTVDDASSIVLNDGAIHINGLPGDAGEGSIKTIILNDKDDGKTLVIEDLDQLDKQIDMEVKKALKEAGVDLAGKDLDQLGEQIDIEVKKALKEAGIDEKTMKNEKIIIINGKDASINSATGGKTEHGKHAVVTKTVIRRVDIKDADKKELKRLGQSTGDKEQKLNLTNMNFYPNPNTGKFNLSFSLPEKGDADITIMNTEGKVVYAEKLPAFSGSYDKEIDISKQAKGIYFVKVEQGKNSQVKKIVLE